MHYGRASHFDLPRFLDLPSWPASWPGFRCVPGLCTSAWGGLHRVMLRFCVDNISVGLLLVNWLDDEGAWGISILG